MLPLYDVSGGGGIKTQYGTVQSWSSETIVDISPVDPERCIVEFYYGTRLNNFSGVNVIGDRLYAPYTLTKDKLTFSANFNATSDYFIQWYIYEF